MDSNYTGSEQEANDDYIQSGFFEGGDNQDSQAEEISPQYSMRIGNQSFQKQGYQTNQALEGNVGGPSHNVSSQRGNSMNKNKQLIQQSKVSSKRLKGVPAVESRGKIDSKRKVQSGTNSPDRNTNYWSRTSAVGQKDRVMTTDEDEQNYNRQYQQAQMELLNNTQGSNYGGIIPFGMPTNAGLLSSSNKSKAPLSATGDPTSVHSSGNPQMRNSKNRKLYTSIGAYSQNQQNKNLGATVLQVPLINFASNPNDQRISQQQHHNSSYQSGTSKKTKASDKVNKSKSIQKNGRKPGNSSVLVVQQTELNNTYAHNSQIAIDQQPHQQALIQAQAYQQMINGGNDGISNINDVSILSNQPLVQKQRINMNNSVVIERSTDNTKKIKKGTAAKQNLQDVAGWASGQLTSKKGHEINNVTQFGNYVGQESLDESSNHTKKDIQKRVPSKVMGSSSGGQKTSQHQQFSHNQIHFLSNFNIEENTSSGQGVPAQMMHQNQMNQNQNVMIQQKQRPHSSFKAQTQKQINSYKQPISGQNNANRGQHLLIGANGVVGIGNGPVNQGVGSKNTGSRKNKHLNINKFQGLGGTGQQPLNSMNVYQTELSADNNQRESRRIGRGSSGVSGSGASTGNELSNIAKDHREMRTSSATAGNTNTEFKLLSMAGVPNGSGQGHAGLNLANQNQNYLLSGGSSGPHAMSGTSGISGGARSSHNNGNLGGQVATGQMNIGNSKLFNMTGGSQNAKQNSGKQVVKSNKISKRNIATNPALNFQFVGQNNILSNTCVNKNEFNQNIDSMRSGDARADFNNSQGGYGISMFPANKYDQQQFQKPKGSNGQSVLSQDGRSRGVTSAASNSIQQNQKSHQQSMQKFLQQQMPQYPQNQHKNGKKLKSSSKQNNSFLGQNSHYQVQNRGGASSGDGSANFNVNKQSSQKLTKKQIMTQGQNLASDRMKQFKDGARKGGTQTAIGGGQKASVLNSSQIQIQNSTAQKQSQSLSRTRGTSQNQKQNQLSNQQNTSIGGGQKVQALSSISGVSGVIGAISGTPGIQGNSKITLIGGPVGSGQRNFYSYVQNTNQTQQAGKHETYNTSSRRNKRGCAATISASGQTSVGPGGSKQNSNHQANRVNVKKSTGVDSNNAAGKGRGPTDFDIQTSMMLLGQSQQLESPQTQSQIQIAENATQDMRLQLQRQRACWSGMEVSNNFQNQLRPKSQNDAPDYAIGSDDADKQIDGMSQEQVPLSGQSRVNAGAYWGDASPDHPIQSHERDIQNFDDDKYNDFEEDPNTVNQSFIVSRNENFDKEQFLDIIQTAFSKITHCLHPKIGNSLSQVWQMYDQYVDLLELEHQQEQKDNATQIQELQSCVTDYQVSHQQMELQIGQNQENNDQKSIQLSEFINQKEDLMVQLKNHIKDNQGLRIQMSKLQEKYDKQQAQINHLKNNIDQHRNTQNEHFSQNQIKSGELGLNLDKMQRKVPEDIQSFVDDPLNLDGSINLPSAGARDFDQKHVRINNGKILEQSRRRLGDGSDGELSSIPSYDALAELNSAPVIKKPQNVPGLNLNLEIGNIDNQAATLAEDGQMIFDDEDDAENIDLAELDIDEEDQMRNSRDRGLDRDPQQSTYSSRVGDTSSEATIDSELFYQITQQQKGLASESPHLVRHNDSGPGSSQEAGMLLIEKSSNRPCPQDKSPIKVPMINMKVITGEPTMQQPQNEDSQESLKPMKMISQKPTFPIKAIPQGKLGFNLDITKLKGSNDAQNVKIRDFQDEFMERAEEFSESWRAMLRKQKRF